MTRKSNKDPEESTNQVPDPHANESKVLDVRENGDENSAPNNDSWETRYDQPNNDPMSKSEMGGE